MESLVSALPKEILSLALVVLMGVVTFFLRDLIKQLKELKLQVVQLTVKLSEIDRNHAVEYGSVSKDIAYMQKWQNDLGESLRKLHSDVESINSTGCAAYKCKIGKG